MFVSVNGLPASTTISAQLTASIMKGQFVPNLTSILNQHPPLHSVLADECILITKTKSCYWNINGEGYEQLHATFANHYNQLKTMIREVAIRIGSASEHLVENIEQFKQMASIWDFVDDQSTHEYMMQELVRDHETVIESLKDKIASCHKAYNDPITAEFLVAVKQQHKHIVHSLKQQLT